jgi:prophage antirepressor-like protein
MSIDDEPYFVGKDVADILGYSRGAKAVQDHVDKEDLMLLLCRAASITNV